jgi:hypothetical protein
MSLICGTPATQAASDGESIQLPANDLKFGSGSVHGVSLVPRVRMTIGHGGCNEVAGAVLCELDEKRRPSSSSRKWHASLKVFGGENENDSIKCSASLW